jgi:hypothetical protein
LAAAPTALIKIPTFPDIDGVHYSFLRGKTYNIFTIQAIFEDCKPREILEKILKAIWRA